MDSFITFSNVASSLAALISGVSLWQAWKANKLQAKVNELDLIIKKCQIEELTKEPAPDLMAEIEKIGKSYRLVVKNIGEVPIFNIVVTGDDFNKTAGEPNIFPYQRLDVCQSMSTLLGLYMGIPSKLLYKFSWKNDKGKDYHKDCWCTW